MKKFLFSFGLVFASAFYVFFGSQNSSLIVPAPPLIANNNNQTVSSVSSGTPVASGSTPTPQPTTNPAHTPAPTPTPNPTPAPKPAGLYTDGTYTGSVADAYYGNVQVSVTVSGGKITDVQFLQYPNTHGTSVRINSQAMPYLKQEAIVAQSANVNIVSGATDTSMAFQQSLAAALTQAKA